MTSGEISGRGEGRRRSARFSLVLLLFAFAAFGADALNPVAPGTRGGPRHDDLAAPWDWKLPEARGTIPTDALEAGAAKEILAAPAYTEDSKAQLRYIDVTSADAPKEEATRIGADAASVKRQGEKLVLTPRSGPPILFGNKRVPATKVREGDRTAYLYAGRIGTGKLFRVETDFQHDAPGSFLVSPSDGRSVFVHEGSDHVSVSPDDARLVTFNDLNAPLTLVVVSLSAEGPAIELVCRVRPKAALELKGWHDAASLDLVLRGEGAGENMPARLERTARGWRLRTPDVARPSAGFSCSEGPF